MSRIACEARSLETASKFGQQPEWANTQTFPDLDEGVDARGLFSTLDFSNVIRMKIGALGQFLDAEAGLRSISSNCQAKDLAVLLFCRH
jgi:hypothetical protein